MSFCYQFEDISKLFGDFLKKYVEELNDTFPSDYTGDFTFDLTSEGESDLV